eukprot:TRINITY_DN5964_c0_g1_i2.p1 TRINITY_DN5964_c0_g1~~TRINITY_DN5964_c0_g1_i2.p1  ORF type:complete len:455 (+),score=75.44 TRINITY_DN5964_c0_g1_i2:115-1365(+)
MAVAEALQSSPPPSGGVQDASALLLHEHERICAIMDEWKALHQQTCDRQIQLMQQIVDTHRCTMQKLVSPASSTQHQNMDVQHGWKPVDKDVCRDDEHIKMSGDLKDATEPEATGSVVAEAQGGVDEFDIDAHFEEVSAGDSKLELWRRCSGLHTVEKWISNYQKHPGGWGALLMIHGIPEVTGRLRSKVENYAIYSALFLSVSMGLLTAPPDFVIQPCEQQQWTAEWWECEILKRFFFYTLAVGVAAHMLSILLGMVFIDVLNEAARDSDIYRMFSKGKGFIATVKCARAFAAGCIADVLAMFCAAKMSLGWEIVVFGGVLAVCVWYPFHETARLLRDTGSIMRYWRTDMGGKAEADDPYKLDLPLMCAQHLAENAAKFSKAALKKSPIQQDARSSPSPSPPSCDKKKSSVKLFF